jgi:hypothetical protein
MPLRYILSIPKCKNIFRCALKLHLMSLKLIVFQYNNSFIQTSKISKYHFFPSFPRPTFQNVITHNIFEILWCPSHRIFCPWFRLIKHINIDICKKRLWLGFPTDGQMVTEAIFWFLKLATRRRQLLYWSPFSLPDIGQEVSLLRWSSTRVHSTGCVKNISL